MLPCLLLLGLPAARCCPSLTALAQAIGITPAGTVYSVAGLRTHLAQEAGGWLGHTLRVRGIADTCATGVGPVVVPCLLDANPAGSAEPLPLAFAAEPAPIARLRRLPLVGDVLPARQVVSWRSVATYRIELEMGTSPLCPWRRAYRCVEAQSLDAAP